MPAGQAISGGTAFFPVYFSSNAVVLICWVLKMEMGKNGISFGVRTGAPTMCSALRICYAADCVDTETGISGASLIQNILIRQKNFIFMFTNHLPGIVKDDVILYD